MPSLELVREDVRRIAPQHLAGIDSVVDLAALSNDSSGELFEESTWQINYEARARIARLAKETGVKRYILPSSCSIYGYRSPEVILDEESETHPMTTYAKANEKAEQATRKLADDKFCVVILRQATVYGVSPRMRFDLAINGMTYGAWESGKNTARDTSVANPKSQGGPREPNSDGIAWEGIKVVMKRR